MDPPTVYIEKEPFLTMILSSVETFKKECLGYIFGRKPSRIRNAFIVTNVMAVQLLKKRLNKKLEQNPLGDKRVMECFKKYRGIFPVIGDFHSHPEWGSHKRPVNLSDEDMKDMIQEDGYLSDPLAIVIGISSINKERILWQNTAEGGIKGSLGKYKFNIKAFRVIINKEGELKEEILFIHVPAALKSLNRALGYA